MFLRGSELFGTTDGKSDKDVGVVVDDGTDLSRYERSSGEGVEDRLWNTTGVIAAGGRWKSVDIQLVRESDFLDMIAEHRVFALEAVFQEGEVSRYRRFFNLDRWKLRQEFSAVSSNSWVKAKKKMTVEKDLDMRCGAKSLSHSIRLLMEAVQIAEEGRISDFKCSAGLHRGIMEDLERGFGWEDFKAKYRPVWKLWHHRLVEACPKPES